MPEPDDEAHPEDLVALLCALAALSAEAARLAEEVDDALRHSEPLLDEDARERVDEAPPTGGASS
jgi:hypothetical protein